METIIGQGPAQGPASADGDLIKDSNSQGFVADVIEASDEVPVIVDFWAPWCAPCKQLGPILEKVVKEANGKVRLVKVDIDQSPDIAQQLRIQSIPAVFAFHHRQPVDGFAGALPESQVREFVGRLTGDSGPSPIEQALDQALAAFAAGDLGGAAALYGEILRQSPGDPAALGGLSRCYVQSGDLERAAQTLAMVPPEHANHVDVLSARASLSLAEDSQGKVGDLDALQAKVVADPNDHQARYDLALALIGANRRAQGVEALIEIVRRDRTWNEEAARKELLRLFEAFGAKDENTLAGRRQLSALLFS